MSAEEVARNFVSMMFDLHKAEAMLTADAMASGGPQPGPVPAMDGINMMTTWLRKAMRVP